MFLNLMLCRSHGIPCCVGNRTCDCCKAMLRTNQPKGVSGAMLSCGIHWSFSGGGPTLVQRAWVDMHTAPLLTCTKQFPGVEVDTRDFYCKNTVFLRQSSLEEEDE